jgi:hypothetical protein
MDKSGAGVGFLRELRFPLPIYIPSCSPQSSSLSPEAGTIGLLSHRKKKIFLFILIPKRPGITEYSGIEVEPVKVLDYK